MGKFSERMIEIGNTYLGKQEMKLTPNAAPWLSELMTAAYNPTGWRPGEPYCMAALCAIAELVCIEEALKFPFAYSKSSQLFYVTALKNNFASQVPERGDIAIFEIGNTAHGHAELVVKVLEDSIITIGFNTSGIIAGNQHNGDGVYAKVRKFANFLRTDKPKLWLRGYVKTSSL
jgi:hypothetical protein